MTTTPFFAAIEGSEGTIIFGNGVPAVQVEILSVHEDHLIARQLAIGSTDHGATLVIPRGSIAYYRFRGGDDE